MNLMKRIISVMLLSLGLAVLGTAMTAESRTSFTPGGDVEWKEVDGVLIPIPPAEHPRLYIRKDGIADLKDRMETPQGRKILEKLRKCSVPMTAEEEAAVKTKDFRYYFRMRGVTSEVQLEALDYLVNGDSGQARRAIESMLDTLKRTDFDTAHDRTRASGKTVKSSLFIIRICLYCMVMVQK